MIESLAVLEDFHFIRPYWLLAVLPLLAIIALLRFVHQQQSGWRPILASHLYQHLITTEGLNNSRPPLWLLGLAWMICVLAIAGPTWERLPQPVYQLNTGKIVLLDMSLSMRATDIKPDRLTRAKYKAIDLVNSITEGETGLVAYAGDAFTISPLTSDAQNLTTLIPSLTPEIMPIAGSDPALGIQAAIELLQNAGYQKGDIYWITDGISNQQMKEVSDIINNQAYRLSVLAVGTEDGAPIRLTNGELLKDSRGAIVLPKLTQSNLRSLTKIAGGRYTQIQVNDDDIRFLMAPQSIGQDSSDQKKQDAQDNFGDKWQEMGPYLLLLLLPFAAYGFRKGLLSVFLVSTLLPVYSPSAHADWWTDMWQTRDQQAMQAFQQQQYSQAADTFKDPLWQGSAHYKNQDYQAALEAFSAVDSIAATYNIGNTLAQLGEIDQAIAAYQKVLDQAPQHSNALANKALLEKLKQEQEQEQEQDKEQEQKQEQEQEQEQQGSSDQPQDDEQQPNDGEQDQDPQQQDNEQQSDPQQSEGQQGQEQSDDKGSQEAQDDAEQQPESSEQDSENSPQDSQDETQDSQEKEQKNASQGQPEPPLTDEQREQLQRMQKLLNRVPDDPAFLLKRKMQIESQQRKREKLPGNIQGNW